MRRESSRRASGGPGRWFRRRLPPALGSIVEAETHFEGHLEMVDVAVDEIAANAGHLEPVKIPQGLRGTVHPVPHRLIDAVGRRTHNLGDLVRAISHAPLPLGT